MNDYYVNPDVTVKMMRKNRFVEYGDRWEYVSDLINGFVYVRIIIYKDDLSIIDNVMTAGTNSSYIAFYNELFYKNNLVAQKAKKKYNRILSRLANNEILIHK